MGGELETAEGGGGGGGGREAEGDMTLRMAMKVLVVEGDDSTRQIIAALLRKCGYRVSTVSNGVAAWEILKERSHGIDLVLTEVELSMVSGFVLLCMITEHYTCKHIPVIMMSSHDSVSVVFKCMLKGAADFLVKPIRKNELTNLWQHVWRRRSSIIDLDFHDGNPPEGKLDASMKGNTHNCSLACTYIGEKTSDAQSSSAKSVMEDESMHVSNIQDSSKTRSMNLSHLNMSTDLSKKDLPSKTTLVVVDDDQQDNSAMLGSEANPSDEICSVNYLMPENDDAGAANIALNKDSCCKGSEKRRSTPATSSQVLVETKECADLSQATNNQQQSSSKTQGFTEEHNDLVSEKDIQLKLNSTPTELSFRRQHHIGFYNKENEYRTLTHSDCSAFSLYTKKDPPTQKNSGFEHEKPFSGGKRGNKDFGNDGYVYHFHDPHTSKIEHSSQIGGLTNDVGIAHLPIRIVPVHVPIMCQTPEFFRREMLSLQGQSLWGNETATLYDEVRRSPSCQQGQELKNAPTANQEELKNAPTADSDGPSGSGSHYQPTVSLGNDVEAMQRYNSAPADVGQNNILADSRPHLKRKECGGSLCCINNRQNIVHDATTESGHDVNVPASDENMPMKACLNQREAALIKFRLKRKDRCYMKKVRYKSRKILAEQRPRVKGQFVRQIRPNE